MNISSRLTNAELKRAYASVILEGDESELSKLWLKHFPGRSLKIPLGLTEEMKRDLRDWAKDKPGWHCRREEAEPEGGG